MMDRARTVSGLSAEIDREGEWKIQDQTELDKRKITSESLARCLFLGGGLRSSDQI